MKDAGTLDLARAAIAKRRAPGQIAPSKYLPDVPRQVHAAGGKVDDARAEFLAGNHPEVPPVVYHSTKGDFHAFRPMSHFGTEKAAHDLYKVGPWNPSHLEMNTKLHNVSIIPAHISLKNPIDVGTEREWQSNRDTLRQVADWMGRRLDKKYAYARQRLKDLVDDPRWDEYPHAMEQRGADIIRDTGHDGIIYTNTIEDPGSRSFITLGPEQVKSAISAREFDPENPDMTKAEGGAITKGDGGGITAYHGGPHDFDAFDISKIGTGEGAQSYGHGLYFAGNEDVARQYRNRVSKDKGAFDIINTKTGKMITEETPGYDTIYNAMKSYGSDFRSGDKSHFIENWKRWSDHHEKNTIPEYEAHGGLGDEVSRMKKQVLDWRAAAELMPYAKMRPKGHMYKVNLNVKSEELLDWDKPISEQHPKVQEALKNIGVSTGLTTWENGASLGNGARLIVHKHPDLPDDEEFNRYEMELPSGQRFGLHRNDVARLLGNPKVENGGVRGATVHQRLVDMANREGAIGEHLSPSSPPMKSGPKWAAEALMRHGIKGIRYLDAGSRGDTDKPTYNYVMFHHDPVKIVDKYAYGGDVDNKPIDLTHEKAKRTMFQTPKHVQDTMTSIADRHAAQVAAYEEAKQAGAFDNAQIGDIYQMPNGTREKIVDHHMIPANRWGSTEPLQATYQGHYPAVSTMPVDSSNQENMRRRAVQSLAGLTRVGGPLRVAKAGGGGMGDNGDAPVDLGVHRFHQQFMGKIKSTMNDMVDAHQKALQAGVFDGYEVGDKLQGQVGPLTVKARYMAKWKPGGPAESIIRRMGQIPTLMDHNGVTYYPMVRLTDADGGEGDYALDAVRGYPKFTGLRVAKKNGGGLKLYSKAARIIRGLAKPEDNAEEMVRIALEKGAKKAELQHADVAPGMASRDQVADYIEAVQPRIGVQKRGEGIGLTDQERDELGYLRSMMPHQRTPENDQRIAELKERVSSDPIYEQYQLPGGENYREHVLTLDSHSHNDPYYARNHWGNTPNPIAHARMSDRYEIYDNQKLVDALNRAREASSAKDIPTALQDGVSQKIISAEEAATIANRIYMDGSAFYGKPDLDKKILHVEELQSDWNNDARRKGFGTGTEQQDYDNFVKDMRQKAVEQSGASPMVKAALEKKYSEMEPHTLARKMGMIEQHQELYRRAKFPGPPQAPYVNPKSDDWAELALKHVLHEAAQGGYDGITFTPDAEQSKRWGGTDFNGMYDKKFPGIAARLVKQHDPSITPSTMQITQGVQGPMIPLTEQARRGILENGFSSFKKGGYVK